MTHQQLGALPSPDGGVTFRVWASAPKEIALVVQDGNEQRNYPLERDEEGYASVHVVEAAPGSRYGYRIDGEGPFPDPCSRSQPDGVHALSEVVDPSAFAWSDAGWRRPEYADLVIYECHIGTLTPGGSFDTAIGQIARLREIGINAVELMPVASCAGRWSWGYDGAALFAPAAIYGGPDGLRRFIDAAHGAGMAVILDVVYNHFGPSGNYSGLYSHDYLTDRYQTPWGPAVNFDGPGSAGTRAFVIQNLVHWAREYHADGFRFDATHAIYDASALHILAEASTALAEEATAQGSARPYLIAESHENEVRYANPVRAGGYGFDGVWADDFHHSVRTALTGDHEGYFSGFDGSISGIARTIRNGFLYEGRFDPGRPEEPRGTRARRWPWPAFVYCIQHHDQVGNRPYGDRLNIGASRGDTLAATLLLLLLPQTPMLFQGQEFAATTPFLYFSDHEPELGKLVTEGRRREFARFGAFKDPELQQRVPDPQDPKTFERSKLDLEEATSGLGSLTSDFFRALLEIRATDPVLVAYRRQRLPIAVSVSGRTMLLEFETAAGRRAIAVNFGERHRLSLPKGWQAGIALSSEEPRFGGVRPRAEMQEGAVVVPGHSALFLA